MLSNDLELDRIKLNKELFSMCETSYIPINKVNQILNIEQIPNEFILKNNKVSLRELSKYMVLNGLKPHIVE